MYGLSFGTRIWIAFVLLISVSILATGWASYYFAANMLQDNSLKMSQDTVNKSAQIVDEKLLSRLFTRPLYSHSLRTVYFMYFETDQKVGTFILLSSKTILDLEQPHKIIGMSKQPLLVPEAIYETSGGFRNDVIFSGGMILEESGEVRQIQ